MRRNFAQVLKEGKVDLKKEYSKLYDLFYGKDPRDGKSLADLISLNFEGFYFRGTCLDLGEFDEVHGFRFEEQPKIFDIDYLVSFCEYIYNFVLHFEDHYFFGQINKSFYLQQINKVIETIGYIQCSEDGFTIFVPKDNAAIAVSESELIPEALSYKIIAYNHHSMKGNLESKRQTPRGGGRSRGEQKSRTYQLGNLHCTIRWYVHDGFPLAYSNCFLKQKT